MTYDPEPLMAARHTLDVAYERDEAADPNGSYPEGTLELRQAYAAYEALANEAPRCPVCGDTPAYCDVYLAQIREANKRKENA